MTMHRLAAGCLCVATTAVADPSGLTGSAIGEMIAGATVEIHAPLGTSLPVHFARDGQLSAQAGSLAGYLGSAADKGRWWIAGDQICKQWDTWFKREPQCLSIARKGAVLHWRRQDGATGTAAVIAREQQITREAKLPGEETRTSRTLDVQLAPRRSPEANAAADGGSGHLQVPLFAQGHVTGAPRAALPSLEPKPAAAKAAPSAAAPANATSPSRSAAATPTYRVAYVDRHDVLNVREGPSAEHAAVGALAFDVRGVAIVGPCQTQWCPVTHGGLSGWVNRRFLESDADESSKVHATPADRRTAKDAAEAPRSCLTAQAAALLARIEARFGPVQVVSTCRAGATVAGSARPSRHASGNAIDFNAGSRKAAILAWLIENHRGGGIMTYAGLEHIHIDIGPHFVALNSGGARRPSRDLADARMGLTGRRN